MSISHNALVANIEVFELSAGLYSVGSKSARILAFNQGASWNMCYEIVYHHDHKRYAMLSAQKYPSCSEGDNVLGTFPDQHVTVNICERKGA